MAEGRFSIPVDELKQRANLESNFRVKVMLKSVENFQKDLNLSIDYVNRFGEIDLETFVELHRNMLTVQPKANLSNFYKVMK